MSSLAVRSDLQPESALLSHIDVVVARLSDNHCLYGGQIWTGGYLCSAQLFALLTGCKGQDEIAFQGEIGRGQNLGRRDHGRVAALHIRGAASPELAFNHVTLKRIVQPFLSPDRHNVQVTGVEKSRHLAAALQPGQHTGPSRGMRYHLNGQAHFAKDARHVLGDFQFVARRVDALEPHQVAA